MQYATRRSSSGSPGSTKCDTARKGYSKKCKRTKTRGCRPPHPRQSDQRVAPATSKDKCVCPKVPYNSNMLVLVETAAGYGLFKVEKASLLTMNAADVSKEFADAERAQNIVSLCSTKKFANTKTAMEEATALTQSRMGKSLKKFLKKAILGEGIVDVLAVGDKALGANIKQKLGIEVVFNPQTNELIRGIRTQLHELVDDFSRENLKKMSLSLSHCLNRFKFKFSPEKVDVMIVQAVGLLDDLNKELNNFAMRLKEWYGWHFPELAKIVTDNVTYAKLCRLIGMRESIEEKDMTTVVPEEIAQEILRASNVSMGTEITENDFEYISEVADRVVDLSDYRASLSDYLKFRMEAIAPNLTHVIGEYLGAKLVAHAGSLMSLAKYPASTIQLLGAEKALFRALKNKTATPKYGLIYQASIVAQSPPKHKGRISRVLAAKLSLNIRVDALGDSDVPTVAIDSRRYVEKRMHDLQNESQRSLSKSFARPNTPKFSPNTDRKRGYDTSGDSASSRKKPKVEEDE
eukprot:Polyplicarium_translucidae@DN2940_c0_g2_i1.p2